MKSISSESVETFETILEDNLFLNDAENTSQEQATFRQGQFNFGRTRAEVCKKKKALLNIETSHKEF
jgi:hypothetical protein